MRDANRNQLWARALIEELARAGVREAVVAPGSRSTPLVLAAAAHPGIRMAVQVDERSAAFLALGVGKGTGRPAAVITTSGTAAANLLPAVVEAAQSETPLLLLTADRPPHLRGADANQAIDQVRLFGGYVRMFEELTPGVVSERTLRHLRSVGARAVGAAVGDPAGPVHLNLPFDKPLEPIPVPGDIRPGLEEEAPLATEGRPGDASFTRIHPRRLVPPRESLTDLAGRIRESRRPLLVAGPVPRPDEVGPALRRVAGELGIPTLADPLSGARFGDGDEAPILGGYDLFLGALSFRARARPDLVLRIGATPVSASLTGALEEWADVPQVVVDGGGRWKDHLAVAGEYVPGDPVAVLDALGGAGAGAGEAEEGGDGERAEWTSLWSGAEAVVREGLERELGTGPFFEGTAMAEVVRWCPEGSVLFASNSMPIRDLDRFVPARGTPLSVRGNRGASGIDGILSTACGVSLGTGATVVAVVGDLALIHDMNGLLALREKGIRVVFVVIQNDGGGIFHRLPIREHEPEFTRYFATPHGREVARVAHLYDLPHESVEGRAGARGDSGEGGVEPVVASLRAALEATTGWPSGGLLEIRTDRNENTARQEEVAAAVRRALDDPQDENG
jgi:2-succinyl-5-enolpyruvyl-6-hydroxy-3-cyclohexene-1-carboxylate synthase